MSVETCQEVKQGVESLSETDITLWNMELAELTPAERIEQAYQRLGGCVIAASSFGPTAPVLLKPLSETGLDIPVVTVRHHHETLKTRELMQLYAEALGLDLRIYDAPPTRIPPASSKRAFAEFQQVVKIEPFQQALEDLQPSAYFSGRMHWQSEGRRDLPFVEQRGAILAINAVVDTSPEAVEEFFEATGWERDPNYFDPTKGPDQKQECGLNTTDYELHKRDGGGHA